MKIQLHASMGAEILHFLQDQAGAPIVAREGCETLIAGQAVASALVRLFGDGRVWPINDIDVFLLYPQSIEQPIPGVQAKGGVIKRPTISNIVPATDVYGHLVFEDYAAYHIRQTQRQGLVNTIVCSEGRALVDIADRRRKIVEFLSTFDFNAVQVGVRLSDQALIWTPAFERFLHTNELLVESNKSPLHTAIRWFRKKEELEGVYGRDEWAMQLLVATHQSLQAKIQPYLHGLKSITEFYAAPLEFRVRYGYLLGQRAAKMAFGKGYEEKFRTILPSIAPYFDIVPVRNDAGIELFSLVARGDSGLRLDVLQNLPFQYVTAYAKAQQGFWRKHKAQMIAEHLEKLAAEADWERKIPHFSRAHRLIGNPESVATPQGLRDLNKALKTMEEHQGLAVLYAMPIAWETVQAIFATIEELAKSQGNMVYGILEHATIADRLREYLRTASSEAEMPSMTREFLLRKIEESRHALESANWLIPSERPAIQLGGFTIRELRNAVDVLNEGQRMHHCVGGYIQKIADGRCAIFSMRTPQGVKGDLTLELQPVETTRFGARQVREAQLRGLLNRNPNDLERSVCHTYVAAMNLSLITRGIIPMTWLVAMVQRMPWRLVWSLANPSWWVHKSSPKERIQHLSHKLVSWMQRMKPSGCDGVC